MATLNSLSVGGTDCKNVCRNFKITKKINDYNSFEGYFETSGLKSLLGGFPQYNSNIIVNITPQGGSAANQFYGKVKSYKPMGAMTEIRGYMALRDLMNLKYSGWFKNKTPEYIIEEMIESGTSLIFSNISGTSSGVTINDFPCYYYDRLNLIRKASELSQNGTNPQFIIYQDGSDATTVKYDRFGRQTTPKTLVVGEDITQEPSWDYNLEELCNDCTIIYSGGRYNATDSGSISTYGRAAREFYNYSITNQTDAARFASQIIFTKKSPIETVRISVNHDSLLSGSYDVLNCRYYITDATIGGTGLGPYTVTEYTIEYPDFVDSLTLSSINSGWGRFESYLNAYSDRLNDRLRSANITNSSNTLRHYHDAEATLSSGTTYTRVKYFTFPSTLEGYIYITFELTSNDVYSNTYGRIYKNGTAIGTEFQWTGGAAGEWQQKSESLAISIAAGDTIELYGKRDSGAARYRNFRIGYDFLADSPPINVTIG